MHEANPLKWGIAHDPCRVGDRVPQGAVRCGAQVKVLLRVAHSTRAFISAVILHTSGEAEFEGIALAACDLGYQVTLAPAPQPHVLFYWFELRCVDGTTCWYVPDSTHKTTAGEVSAQPPADSRGFQVSVYDPSFEAPDWLAGSIMYQVFPDRFARGPEGPRKCGLEYHGSRSWNVDLHETWSDPVRWDEGGAYDPIDFYGGTLAGIQGKLDYLASLGVEVIYLNPIFEARSNHRYDTADYEKIDSLLGGEGDFRALVRAARKRGISVVLDAVLSHTGADSRYFNASRTYGSLGAMQGEDSPFYRWYDFTEQGNGVAYRCWWGDPTLPEVDEHDASWQRYMLGENGVLEKWLDAGASGYRLDVADELPDDVLEKIRSCVKSAKPDAAIIGEVWEDPTTKVSYGLQRQYALGRSLDTVMNYPLRDALVDFALGEIDAYQLCTFLKNQQAAYPEPLYACTMNLLSSHDIERIRTVLALGRSIKDLPRAQQLALASSITPAQDAVAARLQCMIAALLYALPGVPCIYYGDELGMQGGGDPFCRATFPQSPEEVAQRPDIGQDVTEFYRGIGALRQGSEALRDGRLAAIAADEDVLVVFRYQPSAGRYALSAVNRSGEAKKLAIDFADPAIGLPGEQVRLLRSVSRVLEPRFDSCLSESRGSSASLQDGIATIGACALSTALYVFDCPR